jgi:hypothetical protein
MPISRSEPLERQEAAQLVMVYGGEPYLGIPSINEVAAYVPLTRIKDLASEEAVIEIIPDKRTHLDWPPVTVVVTP